MEKKEELSAILSTALAAGAQVAGEAGSRVAVAGAQPKTCATQPEKSVLQEGTLTLGDLSQTGEAP